MRISVVVPTYRRAEALGCCIEALIGQDTSPDEILVVVRREDEASRQRVENFGHDRIRTVFVDVPAGRPGLVIALNAGVAASRGEIVCLTDDDAEAHADWLSRIVETFAKDPSIGAVGGRDLIYQEGRFEDGAASVVGTVSRWGRTVGRHHLGIGPPRDVALLKGVNLSVRGDAVREVGFDARLRGTATEHHWEMALCLRLLRMGYRAVYDPAITVDHRPRPRAAEARNFNARQVRDAAHNETLALLEHLSPSGAAAHLLWATAVGSRGAPGLAQAVRLLLTRGNPQLRLLFGNVAGRSLACWTYLKSYHS